MTASRWRIAAIAGVFGLLALVWWLAGPGPELGPEGERGAPNRQEPIRFGDTQFQTLWINNAIAGFVIEQGYGFPVETIEMTTPIFQQSLENGQIDIMMELWRTNLMDWYLEVTEAGDVIDLGPTYERSTQGFFVPRYVIEGDPERDIEPTAPDLRTIHDLAEHNDVFPDPDDPQRVRLLNCIIGWQCERINDIKIHAYGLQDAINLEAPGSGAALDAAIAGAYRRGQAIASYYWEPTWLAGTFDLVQLEEPPFTEECNAEIQRALTGEIKIETVSEQAGCAYEQIAIHKGIYRGLQERAPEVVEFLERMNVGTDALNQTAGFMETEDADAERAALWFFENFQDIWRDWVPGDIEERLNRALEAAGVDL
ncbi:MAG: glycine betaine ABC transporter substrate-binding protein [Thermaerobacterales bacterium]